MKSEDRIDLVVHKMTTMPMRLDLVMPEDDRRLCEEAGRIIRSLQDEVAAVSSERNIAVGLLRGKCSVCNNRKQYSHYNKGVCKDCIFLPRLTDNKEPRVDRWEFDLSFLEVPNEE